MSREWLVFPRLPPDSGGRKHPIHFSFIFFQFESPSLGCPVRSVFVPLPNKTQRCFFFLVHTHSFVSIPVTLLNIPVPFPTKTCSFFAQRCLRLNNPPHLQTYPNRSYELCLHVFILTSQYQNHHEALPRPPPNIPLRRTRTSRRSTRVPPKRSQHSRQPDRLLLPLWRRSHRRTESHQQLMHQYQQIRRPIRVHRNVLIRRV